MDMDVMAQFLAMWLSTTVAGIGIAAIGGILLQQGRRDLKQTNLVRQRTIDTVKEDAAWDKREAR